MASYNRVIVMGNMCRDIEVKYIGSGTAVGNISLAVNRVWFDKNTNEKKEDVTYVEITLWGKQAETVEKYCPKGSPLHVEGRLEMDTWEDKETGKPRQKLKVVGERIQLLGSKGGGGQSSQSSEPAGQSAGYGDDGDVPF